MSEQNNATHSLAHTKWNCKYHIVFAPKYRRKVCYGKHKEAIREILRTLCQRKGVEIIEGEICPDHIHLLVSIPPKMSASGFVGSFKGKKHINNLCVSCEFEVQMRKQMFAERIKSQLDEDMIYAQRMHAPFTGSKHKPLRLVAVEYALRLCQ